MRKLDFYNRVLGKLNRKRLEDAKDDGESRRVLDEEFDRSLRLVLERFPWRWALRRTVLVPYEYDSGDAQFGFRADLPDDFCRLEENECPFAGRWRLMGQHVFVSGDARQPFTYVAMPDLCVCDELPFDGLFAEAAAIRLAVDCAFALTGEVQGHLMQLYEFALEQAMVAERRNMPRMQGRG